MKLRWDVVDIDKDRAVIAVSASQSQLPDGTFQHRMKAIVQMNEEDLVFVCKLTKVSPSNPTVNGTTNATSIPLTRSRRLCEVVSELMNSE